MLYISFCVSEVDFFVLWFICEQLTIVMQIIDVTNMAGHLS